MAEITAPPPLPPPPVKPGRTLADFFALGFIAFAYGYQGYLLLVVTPRMTDMFASFGAKLPFWTIRMIDISAYAGRAKFLTVLVLAGLVLGHAIIYWKGEAKVRLLCICATLVILIFELLEHAALFQPIFQLSQIAEQ